MNGEHQAPRSDRETSGNSKLSYWDSKVNKQKLQIEQNLVID